MSLPSSTTTLALMESNQPPPPAVPLSTQQLSLQPRQYPYLALTRANVEDFVSVATYLSAWILTARVLVHLLSMIVDTCINIWANTPPLNQVVIEAGSMRLEFGCSMEPVPWDFIAEWGNSRKEAVERGYAPAYAKERWYSNKNQKRLCYVGIRMVPEGAIPKKPSD